MQNNVTYLSRKLQRSLDNNYNVIDMPAVIEIISTLEKTPVTKELLETTRLGKYINELRRKTSNESLAKRAKELLKKWRDLILPDAPNGQLRLPEKNAKKRPADADANTSTSKKQINGQNREYDFSDNSNCSVKELKKTDVIFINSDSNSSQPESMVPGDQSNDALDVPKKRGRKKGSKNHKNLVIAAEESFTNKMAVSRNSKVKTTQELLADIQNRKPTSQDIELRTAQLTESLSRIEHKLNPQKTTTKTVSKTEDVATVVETISEDEIVDVVGTEVIECAHAEPLTVENLMKQLPEIDRTCLVDDDAMPNCACPTPDVTEIVPANQQEKITVEITNTKESLFAPPSPVATAITASPGSAGALGDPGSPRHCVSECPDERTSECVVTENLLCPAKLFLADKYQAGAAELCDAKIGELHEGRLPNVNGNYGARGAAPPPQISAKIVPNMSERLTKTPNENFQKYSISISDSDECVSGTGSNRCDSENVRENSDFREWHETLDVISYNDELLRILPYVIID